MTNKMTTTQARRGSIYILVLVSSLIVTLIGIIGFRLAHTQAAVARADAQRDEAMSLAESAVQWGIHYVMLADDWRSASESGDTVRSMSLGGGTISVAITDADGDLDDSDTDTFTITGTATLGSATQTLSVDLEFGTGGAHPALDQSITVGNELRANAGTLWLESSGTAKDQMRLNGSPLAPPIVAEADPVDMPDPSLIATWAAKGTLIPRATHGGSIAFATFSKSAAPFGLTPDPAGIYVIDAENNHVTLTSCTITGTLVVVNLGANFLTINGSRFNFGDSGGPSLIADGYTILNIGFGPGVSQGIIYIDGDLSISNMFMLVGSLVVTGDAWINTTYVSINDHPSTTAGPPEEFTESTGPEIVPGSWQRIMN